jgi:hypothetical protein
MRASISEGRRVAWTYSRHAVGFLNANRANEVWIRIFSIVVDLTFWTFW